MLRRGGWGSGLGERLGIYSEDQEFEPSGVIYLHAVSVGEVGIALKLIKTWQEAEDSPEFVLAPTTSTGLQLAKANAGSRVRVIYAPLDFALLIRRTLKRFQPSWVVLVESELWPSLLTETHRRNIPTAIINARLSDRSFARLSKFPQLTQPLLRNLRFVGLPHAEAAKRWASLGVPKKALETTGSLKYDPEGGQLPSRDPSFQELLDQFGKGRPIIIGVSTFPGEELLFAKSLAGLPQNPLLVLAPRHAERAPEVQQTLAQAGFSTHLRTDPSTPNPASILLLNTTGELRNWTAHADLAVIGKSFLAKGGQSPVEAILSHVPVIMGPHMQNFEPLASELNSSQAVLLASDQHTLAQAAKTLLSNPNHAEELAKRAFQCLNLHRGAVQRTIQNLKDLAVS